MWFSSMCVLVSGQTGTGKGDWLRKSEDTAPGSLQFCWGAPSSHSRKQPELPKSIVLGCVVRPQGRVWLEVLTQFPFRCCRWMLYCIHLFLACTDGTFAQLNLFLSCVIYRWWSSKCYWAWTSERLSVHTKDSFIPQTCGNEFTCLCICAVSTKAHL